MWFILFLVLITFSFINIYHLLNMRIYLDCIWRCDSVFLNLGLMGRSIPGGVFWVGHLYLGQHVCGFVCDVLVKLVYGSLLLAILWQNRVLCCCCFFMQNNRLIFCFVDLCTFGDALSWNGNAFDQTQFAYQNNRSAEDAVLDFLHSPY